MLDHWVSRDVSQRGLFRNKFPGSCFFTWEMIYIGTRTVEKIDYTSCIYKYNIFLYNIYDIVYPFDL